MQFSPNFILLDAARIQYQMDRAKELNTNHSSLYKGRSEEDLAQVAPYLFVYEEDSEFAKWYRNNGWGDGWGVLVHSTATFEDLYKHFRKFLLVKTEEDQELYFRFYDPWVLRTFLPTCDKEQLREFFGPIEYFICEDEDAAYGLVFSLTNGNLITERLSKEKIFDQDSEVKSVRKFFS